MSIIFSTHFNGIFYPSQREHIDMSAALDALDWQREARIARLATYIFSTIATIVCVGLMESTVINLSITLPVFVITGLAWYLFKKLDNLDEVYTEKLNDAHRCDLAKNEIKRILLQARLDSFTDNNHFKKAFENVNKVLGCRLFSLEYIQAAIAIKNQTEDLSKTLHDIACEKSYSLAIDVKHEECERGLFGRQTIQKELECRWSGKNEDELVLLLKSDLYKEARETPHHQ